MRYATVAHTTGSRLHVIDEDRVDSFYRPGLCGADTFDTFVYDDDGTDAWERPDWSRHKLCPNCKKELK